MNYEHFLDLRAGACVKRFHTRITLRENTNGHHSHGVAMLCLVLTNYKASQQLLARALLHDLAEYEYGDVPAHSKLLMGGDALTEAEERWLKERSNGLLTTGDLASKDVIEKVVLKVADCLDGLMFCLDERKLGNTTLDDVFNRYAAYIRNSVIFEPWVGTSTGFEGISERVRDLLSDAITDWRCHGGK